MNTSKLLISVILTELIHVGPKAKLLLLRFMLAYGDTPLRLTTRELARSLGTPLNSISTATSELDAAGFLIRNAVADGRGRPSLEYRLASDQLGKFQLDDGGAGEGHPLWPLMEYLLREPMALSGEKPPPGDHDTAMRKVTQPSRKGAASKLSEPNRMLLLVLLALADNAGVVRARGAGDIARWVGIRGASVHSQVEKLIAMGYIRAAVPGVAGRFLFGKAAGAYFLNLQHPAYGDHARPAGIYLFSCPQSELPMHRLREIPQVVEAAKALPIMRRISVRLLPNSYLYDPMDFYSRGDLEKLAPLLLNGLESRDLIEFLQLKVEEYAGFLLSTHWGRLCVPAVWDDLRFNEDFDLKLRIIREVVPARFYRGACPGPDVLERYRRLVGLIYRLAIELADVIKQAIHRTRLAPWIKGQPRFEELC